jgi:hypothetical protein
MSGTIGSMSCSTAVPNVFKMSTIHAVAKAQISLSVQMNNVNCLCNLIAYSNILLLLSLSIKFAKSPPCVCHGSSGQKPQHGFMTLAYQHQPSLRFRSTEKAA